MTFTNSLLDAPRRGRLAAIESLDECIDQFLLLAGFLFGCGLLPVGNAQGFRGLL